MLEKPQFTAGLEDSSKLGQGAVGVAHAALHNARDDRVGAAVLEQVCARGDLERARDLYADDFLDHVNALESRGREGIAKSVAVYQAMFPDLRIEVVDQVADGDRVVARLVLHGTHRGRQVTLPGITISRFENGKIAEDWTVSDLGLLCQIGVRRSGARGALSTRRATPMMWVFGGSTGGIRNAKRSHRTISKPAASSAYLDRLSQTGRRTRVNQTTTASRRSRMRR